MGEIKLIDKTLSALIAVSLLAGLLLASQLLSGKNSWLVYDGELDGVGLAGEYRADGGPWLPLNGTKAEDLPAVGLVEIRGHFTRDIEKNLCIMFRLQGLSARMRINGRNFFSFGMPEGHHRFADGGGDVWKTVVSSGITSADNVETELESAYGNRFVNGAKNFLREIYFGSEGAFYRMILARCGLSVLLALFILFFGLLELTAAAFLKAGGYTAVTPLLYNAGYMICGAAWLFIQTEASFLVPFPALLSYLDVFCVCMSGAFLSLYIASYLTGARRRAAQLSAAFMVLVASSLSLFQICGRDEAFARLNMVFLLNTLSFAVTFTALACENLKKRSPNIRLLSLTALLIACGSLCDIYVYIARPDGVDAVFIQAALVVSAMILGGSVVWQYKRKIDLAARVEHMQNELTQSRVAIMVSQIQPHFIYNALATIKALCEIYPESAQEAIARFSKYLRRNMDSLTAKELIPFEQELTHIENYLYIEKIRFQGKVNFIYDIKAVDFFLPPLSVQPLVENALRYGVAAVNGGGTVGISTEENAGGYLVRVRDNGKGFDFMNIPRDDRNHVGIENVKNRIEMMCGGTLSIESRPGEGTLVTIFIPKVITDESDRG